MFYFCLALATLYFTFNFYVAKANQFIFSLDVPMGYFAGELQLIAEPVNYALIRCYLGVENFQRYLLFDFCIVGFIDPPHASFSKLLDHFISLGESAADTQFFERRLECGGLGGRDFPLGSDELSPAAVAEAAIGGVFKLATRALHRPRPREKKSL
jgi:hypothetical protein